MRFADPKNDLAFKKIFGNEAHKEILISFLNSLLDFKDEKTIVDVTLLTDVTHILTFAIHHMQFC